jgi:hypothetical protein
MWLQHRRGAARALRGGGKGEVRADDGDVYTISDQVRRALTRKSPRDGRIEQVTQDLARSGCNRVTH